MTDTTTPAAAATPTRSRHPEYDAYEPLRAELDALAELHARHRDPYDACAAMDWAQPEPPKPCPRPTAPPPQPAAAPVPVASATMLPGVRNPLAVDPGTRVPRRFGNLFRGVTARARP